MERIVQLRFSVVVARCPWTRLALRAFGTGAPPSAPPELSDAPLLVLEAALAAQQRVVDAHDLALQVKCRAYQACCAHS